MLDTKERSPSFHYDVILISLDFFFNIFSFDFFPPLSFFPTMLSSKNLILFILSHLFLSISAASPSGSSNGPFHKLFGDKFRERSNENQETDSPFPAPPFPSPAAAAAVCSLEKSESQSLEKYAPTDLTLKAMLMIAAPIAAVTVFGLMRKFWVIGSLAARKRSVGNHHGRLNRMGVRPLDNNRAARKRSVGETGKKAIDESQYAHHGRLNRLGVRFRPLDKIMFQKNDLKSSNNNGKMKMVSFIHRGLENSGTIMAFLFHVLMLTRGAWVVKILSSVLSAQKFMNFVSTGASFMNLRRSWVKLFPIGSKAQSGLRSSPPPMVRGNQQKKSEQ